MKIDTALVTRLVAAQFPQWAHLPVTRVEPGGWDNRTFRLGTHLSVRLPSAPPHAEQVAKEQHWLPRLALHLPLPIPTPVAMGTPGPDFPWHWSVYRWLEGDTAAGAHIADTRALAIDLARFLNDLRHIDTSGAPPPGLHNFHRGAPLSIYDAQTREAMTALRDCVDGDAATALWQSALDAQYRGSPVWEHGDVAAGNLLVRGGVLSGVIDFGCCAVGDPACDFTIAWTLFDADAREAFRVATTVDDGTWNRGAGWALWKALITLIKYRYDVDNLLPAFDHFLSMQGRPAWQALNGVGGSYGRSFPWSSEAPRSSMLTKRKSRVLVQVAAATMPRRTAGLAMVHSQGPGRTTTLANS